MPADGVIFAAGQPFFDNVLTDFYLPVFADARNNSAVLWSLMPRGRRRVAGKFIKFPVRFGRNFGGNAIFPGGSLPVAGHQGAHTYAFKYRHYYQAVQLDGPTIDAAGMDAATYADAIDTEVNGAFDDIVVDQNRMLHNDGSGRRAEVDGAVVGSTTVNVKLNSSILSAGTCPTRPTRFLEPGMQIAFCTIGSGGVPTAIRTIDSITDDDTIELDSVVTLADGEWVVSASDAAFTDANSNAFRTEPMGLAGISTDTGVFDGNGAAAAQVGSDDRTGTDLALANFQGLPSDGSLSFNQGVVNTAVSTRALSESLLQQTLSDFEEENNGDTSVLLSSYATYNSYFDILKGDKRYNNTLDLKGGHKVLTFNGIGWVKDRFTYGGRVLGLGLDQFYLYEVVPLQWVDQDGLKFRKIPGKDDWAAELKTRYTVGVDVRQRATWTLADLAA